jgi:hypothetical protein
MKTALLAFRSFLSSLTRSEQGGLEAYLARSQSLADLERREREWHRSSADRALMTIDAQSQ